IPAVHLTYSFFLCDAGLMDLHSFPTRRSSDLEIYEGDILVITDDGGVERSEVRWNADHAMFVISNYSGLGFDAYEPSQVEVVGRSEEHTSELQSRENLVCRLLLEKKNK